MMTRALILSLGLLALQGCATTRSGDCMSQDGHEAADRVLAGPRGTRLHRFTCRSGASVDYVRDQDGQLIDIIGGAK